MLSGLQSAIASTALENQRKDFVLAEQQAAKGSWKTVEKWRASLGSYPLWPYVEMAYLKNHAYRVNEQRINNFLNIYQSTPLEWPVRRAWLNYLIEKGDAEGYLKGFKATSDSRLNCYQLRFKLKMGASITSLSETIAKLWVVNKSQPKACDPLFKAWTNAGLRTNDMIKQRIVLAADGGSHSLIPYLSKLLPAKERAWASAWHKTRRNPATILNSRYVKTTSPEWLAIHWYGLKRLIWRDPERALKHYQTLAKKGVIQSAHEADLALTFGLALASKKHPEALVWLAKIPTELATEKTNQWHLATLLREDKWSQLVTFILSLSAEKQQEAAHRYWLARAYAVLGKTQEANTLMRDLAGLRHYYGFLAAAHSGLKYQLNHDTLQQDPKIQARLQQAPAAKRAYEFLQLGRDWLARSEWYKFRATLTKTEQGNAAYLAHQWHWYDQALRGISLAGFNNDVLLRFPKAYQSDFQAVSAKLGVNFTLAMAIARRESSFAADARSGVGARGLMQIMPATARVLKGRRFNIAKLYDPQTNIAMGTGYIKQLIARMDGDVPRAIASYNAGWGRVKKWLPDEGSMPMDIWIENIPYTETRNYVKAVLAYQQVYEMLQNKPKDIFSGVILGHVSAKE